MAKTIEMTRRYPYARELVWQALTDPEALAEWMMDNDFKLEVGHKFRFTEKPQGEWRGFMECEVLAFEAPRSLTLSWQGMPDHTVQTVTFTLSEDGDQTVLHLMHDGFDRTMGRFDGWMLRKILGYGWKKMFDKQLPKVLKHLRDQPGVSVPRGLARAR